MAWSTSLWANHDERHGGEDRGGDRDGPLFRSPSPLEAQELGLQVGVLGTRRREGALHEHWFERARWSGIPSRGSARQGSHRCASACRRQEDRGRYRT